MVATTRRVISLVHVSTGRIVPIDVKTVIGRSDGFYRYGPKDDRPDRLRPDTVNRLAGHNYIMIPADNCVSRVHGLVDPGLPAIFDLNTRNGTFVNGSRVAFKDGETDAPCVLGHSDVLQVGQQDFRIGIHAVDEGTHLAHVFSQRLGVVFGRGPHEAAATRLARHLVARKRFRVRQTAVWSELGRGVEALERVASRDGIALVAYCGPVDGETLLGEDGRVAFETLVASMTLVPGRKVLVVEGEGDTTAIERVFAAQAFEDMMLLTSPGEVVFPPNEAGTARVGRPTEFLRQSVSGESPELRGAFDDAVDGIEALVPVDANALEMKWVEGYRGRLKLTFGTRARGEDQALSHSLRIGTTIFRLSRPAP